MAPKLQVSEKAVCDSHPGTPTGVRRPRGHRRGG